MKRIKLIAFVTAVAASLTLASASSDESADGYVADAISAARTISYVGTVEVVRIGSHGAEATVYRVEHRAPNWTKRYYLSPSTVRGDEVVTKGDETFAVNSKRHRVIEVKNGALGDHTAFHDNVALLRSNYRATEGDADSLDGRPIEEITLVNKYTRHATMVMCVDRVTKLVLDKQVFAGDGSLISEMRFEDIRYSPQPSATDFALPKAYAMVKGSNVGTPSRDILHVVQSAGFAARTPRFLPDGFSPTEGNIAQIQSIRVLHVLYTDGIRTISLFEHAGTVSIAMGFLHPETTTVAGQDAQYATIGATTLLSWTDGQLRYALVGDLRLDELEHIAASMKP